jgi:hypothetical protein
MSRIERYEKAMHASWIIPSQGPVSYQSFILKPTSDCHIKKGNISGLANILPIFADIGIVAEVTDSESLSQSRGELARYSIFIVEYGVVLQSKDFGNCHLIDSQSTYTKQRMRELYLHEHSPSCLPVLSAQTTLTDPSVSTDGSCLTIA